MYDPSAKGAGHNAKEINEDPFQIMKDGPLLVFENNTIPSTILTFFFDIDTDTVPSLSWLVSQVIWFISTKLLAHTVNVYCLVLYWPLYCWINDTWLTSQRFQFSLLTRSLSRSITRSNAYDCALCLCCWPEEHRLRRQSLNHVQYRKHRYF